MSPSVLCDRLAWCEVDSTLDPDCRRVLRDERFSLLAALRSSDAARIKSATAEALRVCAMWGVGVRS